MLEEVQLKDPSTKEAEDDENRIEMEVVEKVIHAPVIEHLQSIDLHHLNQSLVLLDNDLAQEYWHSHTQTDWDERYCKGVLSLYEHLLSTEFIWIKIYPRNNFRIRKVVVHVSFVNNTSCMNLSLHHLGY